MVQTGYQISLKIIPTVTKKKRFYNIDTWSSGSLLLFLRPVRETDTKTGFRATATAAVSSDIPTNGAISNARGLIPPPPPRLNTF